MQSVNPGNNSYNNCLFQAIPSNIDLRQVLPSQAWELNAALKPILAYIPNAYLIHDNLIIAGKTFNEHNLTLQEVMKAIDESNLTLNLKKCSFGKTEIAFWRMIFS